jgi:hypothetical protein
VLAARWRKPIAKPILAPFISFIDEMGIHTWGSWSGFKEKGGFKQKARKT